MYQNGTKIYIKQVVVASIPHPSSILTQSKILLTSHEKQTNSNKQTVKISDTLIDIIAKIEQEHVSLQTIQQLGKIMEKEKQSFLYLFRKIPKLVQSLSCNIMLLLKEYDSKQVKISNALYLSLLAGMSANQKILEGMASFKLFLALTQGELHNILKKTHKDVLQNFALFVNNLQRIENYVKNQQPLQFATIRGLFYIGSLILCWAKSQQIPKNFYNYVQRVATEKIKVDNGSPKVSLEKQIKKFCQLSQKYGLVDPQYRVQLIKTVGDIFSKGIQNQFTVQLFGTVVALMNKRIFLNYQNSVIEQLALINQYYLKPTNTGIFAKMVGLLLEKKGQQFLVNYHSQLLNFGVNQQSQILLFSLYYEIFTGNIDCDPSIINKLIQWNIKLCLIPAEEFVDKLVKAGLSKISPSSQRLIYAHSSMVWNPIILKIMEARLKQFLDGKIKLDYLIQQHYFDENVDIYRISTRMLIQSLIGIQIDKTKQIPSILQINPNTQIAKKIKQQSVYMFQKAIKYKIKCQDFLRNILTLNSLLQNIRQMDLQNQLHTIYYLQAISFMTDQQINEFLHYLLSLFRVCKNCYVLFLVLCFGLSVYGRCRTQHNEKEKEKQKQTQNMRKNYFKTIEQVLKTIQAQGFVKILSYHIQNIKLLFLLSYLFSQEQQFCKNTRQIIFSWSALYAKAEIDIILYNFDQSIYNVYTRWLFKTDSPASIQTWGNKAGKSIAEIINCTLRVVLGLLRSPSSARSQYLCPQNNCIHFIPIRHSNHRNSIHIQFKALINYRLCCNSSVDIYGSSRNSTGGASIQKHRLKFKHKKIIVHNRTTKQIQACFEDIEDEMYAKPFTIAIKIANCKLIIQINKSVLLSKQYDFAVDSIRFDIFGDILIKDFKWQRFQQEERSLDLKSSYNIYPSDAQVKVLKIGCYEIRNFQQKLSLFYLAAYLQQIVKASKQSLNISKFYEICCFLLLIKEGSTKNQYTSAQFSCLKKTFRVILMSAQNIKPIQLPNFSNIECNVKTKKFYQFILASILNEKFLQQSSRQSKIKLLQYLQHLLFDKDIGFGFAIQNTKTQLFLAIVKLVVNLDQQLANLYIQLLKKIIYTHEVNQILLKKITIIFSLAYTTKSQSLKRCLDQIFEKIVSVLNIIPSDQNYHLKIIGKFILSQYKNLQYLFMIISIDIKLKMLDNMIDDEDLSPKCQVLFRNLPEQQILQLSDRIIVYSKKAIFDFFDAQRRTQLNLSNLLFFIKEVAIVYDVVVQQTHKQDILAIINNFNKKFAKLLNENLKPEIIEQIESLYFDSNFVKLVAKKIEKQNQSQFKDETEQALIHSYFNLVLLKMPKLVVLKALSQFFKLIDYAIDTCAYILKFDFIIMIPQRSLSAFLQFLIEILYKVQQQDYQAKSRQIAYLIHEFLQKLIKNYSKVCEMSRPLLYSYPKMEKIVDFNNFPTVQKAFIQAKQGEYFQLKGGIFLKLICIFFHLLQILPNENFSIYVQFILDKIATERSSKNINVAVYRATNDFIQVNKDIKNRSPIDIAMREVQKQHLNYFTEKDEEIVSVKLSPSRSSSGKSINVDLDLTPFFIDFFFMKLFMYLENHCIRFADQEIINNCQKYSKESMKYLKQFEHIWDEMNQKNGESIIDFEKTSDLYKMFENQEDLTVSDRVNSPEITFRRVTGEASNINVGFIQASKDFQEEINNLGTPVKEQRLKRRSTLNFQLTSGKKKKKQILSNIQSTIYAWSDEAKKKRIHRFFRDESKQILFYELLHQVYIEHIETQTQKQAQVPKIKKLMEFINEQQQKVNDEIEKGVDETESKANFEVRKVQRFTSKNSPCLKIRRNQLPNFTNPFVSYIDDEKICGLQKNQQLSFNPDIISSMLQINKDQFEKQNQINLDTIVCLQTDSNTNLPQKENICQISYPKGVYYCEWQFSKNGIQFVTKKSKKAQGKHNQRIIKYGAPLCNILPIQGKKIEIKIQQIHEILFRKYNQIKKNSLQFFMINGFSIYVVFYTEQRTKLFIQKCCNKFAKFRSIKIVENFIKAFQAENYTQKWVVGQMSNFDYLMIINKYAGRTFCDINQYYIFPWILQDYTSKSIDLSYNKTFRDLKKPIGALRQQKLQKYLEKISKNGDPSDSYLYGSHYSTSLFIYYYLVRLEPFTSLHKDMQGGEFDAPDRLFSSIQQMWECLMSQSSTSDIKEAIPQFYYLPTFLKNINNLQLGKKQSGSQVNHVQLPPWANSPADFILKMRVCLQSDYVSANLNYWIDLIFGKDQKSQQKYNVFHPLSYVENIRPDRIQFKNLDAVMNQITFFGQNPHILFQKQHPKKKIKMSSITTNNIGLYTSLDLSSKQNNISQTKIYEQQNLQYIFYVSEMQFKTKSTITLKISGISKSSVARVIDLDMQNTIHSLIRNIQKFSDNNSQSTFSMKRLLSQNNIEIPEEKIQVKYKLDQNQIKFRIGFRQVSEVVNTIKLQYRFQNVKFNEIVLVVYGSAGLRVYDWTYELIWEFSDQLGEISDCYLQPGLVFFTISTGKLYVYDFFNRHKEVVFEFSKPTYHVSMLVYAQRKFITKKNQNSYKFVLIGDKRKIILLYYTHKIGKIYVKN